MRVPAFPCLLLALACCAGAASAQANGSFETNPPGLAPFAWTVTGGNTMVQSTPDALFPSHGNRYLMIDPGATGPAIAGYGPHAPGSVGQVTQVVPRPAGSSCAFFIDWEFLPLEGLPSGAFNDFFSVDIVDNTTNALITNVVFIDTGVSAGVPFYTNVPGAAGGLLTYVPNQSTAVFASGNHAPAGFKRAWVDLSAVPVGTPMRIEISVGNGGDTAVDSVAYVDNVRLVVAERNWSAASLRLLGSSHADGFFSSADQGGDFRPETPFTFRASAGQRLALRASSIYEGTPWLCLAGTLLNPGWDVGGLGIINLDLSQPTTVLFNGFSSDPFTAWLGTITFNVNYYDLQIADGVPNGLTTTLQGVMANPIAATGLSATAPTVFTTSPPKMPVGTTVPVGGANSDDGFTNVPFAVFGGGVFSFYGVARPAVFIGSNGFLTFVSGDTDFTETEAEMLTDQPRIALCWDDLTPDPIGVVAYTETFDTFAVSYSRVREFASLSHGTNMAVQLYDNGVITIYYEGNTMADGLGGISPGGLLPPPPGATASMNLSPLGFALGGRGITPPGAPTFQSFANPIFNGKNDLFTLGEPARITFVPDGLGGYTFFTGTR